MICPFPGLEYGIPDLNDASTMLGFGSNIHDGFFQITDHRFLILVYPDAGETEKSGCIMLNELIRNSPEIPDGWLHLPFGDHIFPGLRTGFRFGLRSWPQIGALAHGSLSLKHTRYNTPYSASGILPPDARQEHSFVDLH